MQNGGETELEVSGIENCCISLSLYHMYTYCDVTCLVHCHVSVRELSSKPFFFYITHLLDYVFKYMYTYKAVLS